jgi:CRISPR-associated protein Cmr1
MPRAKVVLPTLEDVKNNLQTTNTTLLERKYKLLTPLYGGGVKAGENDPSLLIRPTSIRGHLRFWWRAARASKAHIEQLIVDFGLQDSKYHYNSDGSRGAEFNDLEKLRLVESWIWGIGAKEQPELKNLSATEKAQKRVAQSRVQVSVFEIKADSAKCKEVFEAWWEYKQNEDNPTQGKWGWKTKCLLEPQYLYFAMRPEENKSIEPEHNGTNQEKSKKIKHGEVWTDVEFSVKITFANALLTAEAVNILNSELAAALWAWEIFGGLGARTRKGFGALTRLFRESENPFNEQTPRAWLERNFQTHVKHDVGIAEIPRISDYSNVLLVAHSWENTIRKYQNFRQKRNPGNGTRPGRSKWTEADSIRQITNSALYRHRTPLIEHQDATGNAIERFPRAVLGLPIIFQFIGAPTPTMTLEGQEHERLTSPVIIRPIQLGSFSGSVVLVLKAPRVPPGGLKLKEKPRVVVEHEIKSYETDLIPTHGETDVIKALCKELT